MDECLCLSRTEEKINEDAIQESAVLLHVYDLDSVTSKVNAVTRHVAQSGVFHVGVQVYGDEWSFGQHDDISTGVTCNRPKEHCFHVYRESVHMGDTDLSRAEVWLLLERLKPEWPGNSYHLFQRNCITFADVLCHELGVSRVPEWVWRLPRHGAGLAEQIKTGIQNLREIDEAVGVSSGMNKIQTGMNKGLNMIGLGQARPPRGPYQGLGQERPWATPGGNDYRGLPPPLPRHGDVSGGGYTPATNGASGVRWTHGGVARSNSFGDPHPLERSNSHSNKGGISNDSELIERMSRSSDAIPLPPSSRKSKNSARVVVT